MGSPHQITAESAWIYRIFTFGPARVSLTGETIHFEEHLGDALARMPVDAISSITVHPSWFWQPVDDSPDRRDRAVYRRT